MKFCRDCKHILKSNFSPMYWHCAKTAEYSMVSGEATYRFAEFVRTDKDACGIDAVLFEQADEEIAT